MTIAYSKLNKARTSIQCGRRKSKNIMKVASIRRLKDSRVHRRYRCQEACKP